MRSREEAGLIGVVVYEGVEPIDIGGTVGVVSMASRVLPQIRSVVIAENAGPVKLAGGLTVLADSSFADAPACDVMVVTGGPGWKQQVASQPMLEFLRAQPRQRVASVCTGALILAAAGVLGGLRATTRRCAVGAEDTAPLELLQRLRPPHSGAIEPVTAAVAEAGGVVTGGGVSLAIDTTLYLIGRIYGTDAMDEVARVIEYDRALAANRDQLGYATD